MLSALHNWVRRVPVWSVYLVLAIPAVYFFYLALTGALSIEPITPFGSIYGSSEHPDLAGEEALAEMYEVCNQMLKERGLNRYEVSNWAKGGH